MIREIGMIAAIVMPLWNIPLIMTIERRKSSKDISVSWAIGVFVCILLMLPAALTSPDPAFRAFGAINALLFGGVVVQIVRYR